MLGGHGPVHADTAHPPPVPVAHPVIAGQGQAAVVAPGGDQVPDTGFRNLMRSVGCFWKARLQQRLAGQHSRNPAPSEAY